MSFLKKNSLHEEDVTELKNLVAKILKAYTIRTKLLHKRREALEALLDRHGSFNLEGKDIYNILENTLKHESRILDIILDKKHGHSNLDQAIELINKASEMVKQRTNKKEFIKLVLRLTSKIRPDKLIYFLEDMGVFLGRIKRSLHDVQKRMDLERKFIAERNESSFSDFLKEWRKEVRENNYMVEDVQRMIKTNSKIINGAVGSRTKGHLFISSILSGTGFSFVIAIIWVCCQFLLEVSKFLDRDLFEDHKIEAALAKF